MTSRHVWLAMFLVGCAASPALTFQQRDRPVQPLAKAIGTATVAGKVISSETGETPVRRAIVTLVSADGKDTFSTITDNEGRFAFQALVDGRYTLNARKASYLSTNFGARRPGRPGTALILAAGQRLTDLRMVLSPGGVIAGVARLPTGEPVTDTQVVAIPVAQATAGGRTVDQTTFRTDDRGEFRIYGLTPGAYLVAVMPTVGRGEIHQRTIAEFDELTRALSQRTIQPGQPGATPPAPPPPPAPVYGFAPTFFPGTPVSASASPITVRAGEVRDGVDIPVSMVRVSTITGVVRSADGQPTQDVLLSVTPLGPTLPLSGASMVRTNRPDKDGRFTLSNVAPGAYRISARAGGVTYSPNGDSMSVRSAQQTEWAAADVQVQGDDVEGLVLQLQSGLTFSGRIVVAAGGSVAPPASWAGGAISIQEQRGGTPGVVLNGVPVSGGLQRNGPVVDDGAFEVTGVQPASYDIEVTLPVSLRSTWFVQSIVAGGRDVRDAPLTFDQGSMTGVTITVTDRPSDVSGTLTSTTGQAAADYFVVLFPEDRALWHERSPRIRVMRPAADGGFSTRNLLPGAYRMAAVTDVDETEWRTTAFLASVFDASIPVVVIDGGVTRQDIRIR